MDRELIERLPSDRGSGKGVRAPDGTTERWISVGDRLPEVDSGEVLVWLTVGRCAFDEWHAYHEDPTGLGGGTMYMGDMWRAYEFEEVTHWMPLPERPGEAVCAEPAPEALRSDNP